MGNCKSTPQQNSNIFKEPRKPFKKITIKDAPLFIPPISKYGFILDCVALNHYIVASYMLIPNTQLFSFNIYVPDILVPTIESKNNIENVVAKNGIQHVCKVFLRKKIILSNLNIDFNGNYVADIALYKKKQKYTISEWLIQNNYGIKKTQQNKNDNWNNLYQKRPTLMKPKTKIYIQGIEIEN